MLNEIVEAAELTTHFPTPSVFAPPLCTFTNPDRARTIDITNIPALYMTV
jgi:hypothetical protein